MKQVLQCLATGSTIVSDVPSPAPGPGQLLIRTECSLVSAGTERMLVEFGKANLIDKARSQPDKVKQVVSKVRADGVIPALDAVRSKLDQPLPLGYCNVGTVIAIGTDVSSFQVGDRVASNGPHSELVVVPQNLCARIPDGVTNQAASFTVPASIGLQGIRLAQPTLGETFLVSGLGLIGLLTAQLLVSQGCRVLCLDPDLNKCTLAESLGLTVLHLSSSIDPVDWCFEHTGGVGVDGVLITASTPSNEPVQLAAQVCRQRGRIVLVGVTGLQLQRDLFYKKELTFQVSCSYGPGRYDTSYEQKGNDYPIGFVRWTEQRNFQAVLYSLSTGSIRTEPLLSHTYSIDQATDAYQLLTSQEPSLGILLLYPGDADPKLRLVSLSSSQPVDIPDRAVKPQLSVIGAGNYASRVLVPSFNKAGACFHTIAATSGVSPVHVGNKYGFRNATTDPHSLLSDPTCNAIAIATRHDSHASLIQKSLLAGKHVFVEKPLCLTHDELIDIEKVYSGRNLLMVGFNRRFAPLVADLRRQISPLFGPKAFIYTCNAGPVPSSHWTQDPSLGGGRLLGEACHFVDLLRFLADSPIEKLNLISALDSKSCPDTFSLQLSFANGSIGTIHYFANGSKSFPKERLEVFADSKVFCIDNFRKFQAWGLPGFRTRRLLRQDKGHHSCCLAFLRAIESAGPAPIPCDQIFEVQRCLLEALNQ